jgi:hypothetical protein
MNKNATFLVALTLFVVVSTGYGLTFTASKPGDNPGETLKAKATFVVSNLNLVVTLENTATFDPNDPADILTAVIFNIQGNPKLTPVSAELGPDSSVIGHALPMGFNGDVGGEWAYRNGLTKAPQGANEGISAANLKWFNKKTDLFPGDNLQGGKAPSGINFGLTTLNDFPGNNKGGTKNQHLIQTVVVFTFAGLPENFNLSEISDVTFQYGKSLKQPEIAGELIDVVPEPSAITLVAAGLLGAVALARRKIP